MNLELPLAYWQKNAPIPRDYQKTIFKRATRENLLVVVPTGLGKTLIAALLGAYYLESKPMQKIIFLAPTRPLINQHITSLRKFLDIQEKAFEILTGMVSPEKRQIIYNDPQILFLFMTPQTLNNDLTKENYSLSNVSLIIFDEAHRASGQYAYCAIANYFTEHNSQGRIIALTASPGSTQEKIETLCKNLKIFPANIEFRDKYHEEVRKYSHETNFISIGVEMNDEMNQIHQILTEIKEQTIYQYIEKFSDYQNGAPTDPRIFTQGYCAKMQSEFAQKLKFDFNNGQNLRILLSINARLMKLFFLIKNLEAEGLPVVYSGLQKTAQKIATGKASKADLYLYNDFRIQKLLQFLNQIQETNPERLIHPKMEKLKEILASQFEESPNSRILLFTKYRSTVNMLVKYMKNIPKCFPRKFVGQATKSQEDQGMSQKKQIQSLNDFKKGIYNVLVATNVAEEGLDIAECNLVIFYDNTASEIRFIQRSGRTGRSGTGKVILLYTRGTSDEICLRVAQMRKAKLKKEIGKITKNSPQQTLSDAKTNKNSFHSLTKKNRKDKIITKETIGNDAVNQKKKYRTGTENVNESNEEHNSTIYSKKEIEQPLTTYHSGKLNKIPMNRVETNQISIHQSFQQVCTENASKIPINTTLQIDPKKFVRYHLDRAIPLGFEVKKCEDLYDLSFPAIIPTVGILFLELEKLDLSPRNFSFHQSLIKLRNHVPHLVLFLDACTLDKEKLYDTGQKILNFKCKMQIAATIFTNLSILHTKLRNILIMYQKSDVKS